MKRMRSLVLSLAAAWLLQNAAYADAIVPKAQEGTKSAAGTIIVIVVAVVIVAAVVLAEVLRGRKK